MKEVLLYDIRSNYNVGAIFRTADGAGVKQMYLAGYTPAPIDRFGRVVPEIHKTALGAETTVPWERLDIESVIPLLEQKKQAGVTVVVVEQSPRRVWLSDFVVPSAVLYVFGSEVVGVPPEVVAVADVVVELPMLGAKESLNVSVTAGIVLYHT